MGTPLHASRLVSRLTPTRARSVPSLSERHLSVVPWEPRAIQQEHQFRRQDQGDIRGFEVGCRHSAGNVDFERRLHRPPRLQHLVLQIRVSIGNSQARQIDFSRVSVSNVYTVITNNKHGKQVGTGRGAHCQSECASFVFQIFDLNRMAYAGPLKFSGLYAESLFRIGQFRPVPASATRSTSSTNCLFNFMLLHDEATASADRWAGDERFVEFVNCTSSRPRSCRCSPPRRSSRAAISSSATMTRQALRGVLLQLPDGRLRDEPAQQSPARGDNARLQRRCDPADAVGAAVRRCGFQLHRAQQLHPPCASGRPLPHAGQLDRQADDPGSSTLASMTSVARTNRAITFTLTSGRCRAWMRPIAQGLMPGCVAVHYPSGTAAFIRSTDTTTRVIIAEMQNNYVKSGSNYNVWDGTDFATGTWYFLNGLSLLPTRMLWGDFVAGNANIINVQSAGGTFDANLGLTVGDMLAGSQYHDQPISGSTGLVITALAVPRQSPSQASPPANPGVVTTAAAHGLVTGEIVNIASVVGHDAAEQQPL
jgi:hypothetical protein